MQYLWLAASYRQHREFSKVIRKVMAIGYLPVLLVRQNFHLLRTSRRSIRLCRRFPELTDFLDYFQRNYLNANGSFPPQMWNVFGRTMDNKTNNNVESKYELKVPFCNICMNILLFFFNYLNIVQ